jgi:glutamate-1-semialdehyde 2,1-aminomutase
MQKRLHEIIPGGSHTYSKGDDQFPSNVPKLISHAKGAYCWDLDKVRYLDWAMGNRVMCLGHANDFVDLRVFEALRKGANFTRPGILEYCLAEYLIEHLPVAEMVKFAKNGSDVVTAAVKLSRAYTDRSYILVCGDHPFFAIHDWFIGSTPINAGTLASERPYTIKFKYGDRNSVETAFEKYPGQIAAVILEPIKNDSPFLKPRKSDLTKDGMVRDGDNSDNFLSYLRQKTNEEGSVLIFDEMISAMRFGSRGAHHHYKVYPDLATYGKAISNGYSCSVLAGKAEIMDRGGIQHENERVFLLSQTHGSETIGLAATLATMEFYEKHEVDNHIWSVGQLLKTGLTDVIKVHNLCQRIQVIGFDANPQIIALNENGAVSAELYSLMHQYLIDEGILMPWISITYSHRKEHVEYTVAAFDRVLRKLKSAIENDSIHDELLGPPQKPVFRKFN